MEESTSDVLTGGLAALVWGIAKGQPGNGADAQQEAAAKAGPMEAPRENAVLVFGSTGKLGRQIVAQLNPGGVLNHKYAGEWAVRGARVPYAVVRSTGLGLPPTPSSPPPQPWVTPPPPSASISSPPALPGQELRSPPPAVPHADPPVRQGPPLPPITPWNVTRWRAPSPPPGNPLEYSTPIDPEAAASNSRG
ncbi:hypothetical protein WJX75_003966 [Coccomyxa subellipsoidea]|uniref:NmrA-like domain-containing protein n=1 Tax=Coccomyxa subellipsoidea TaxID=248742 RepID=A0ABR2YDS4_9CHLO